MQYQILGIHANAEKSTGLYFCTLEQNWWNVSGNFNGIKEK
jgi:hypothetical protein